jgi:hypothetical protein
MFSYYGSKSKIVDMYPKPLLSKIIEPFAGSARYSLRYFENEITLVDKYKVIVDIWKHLQKCSENDIKKLPVLKKGDIAKREMFDCEESFLLYGFMVAMGSYEPRKQVTEFAEKNIPRQIKNISKNLFKIKHWEIIHGDYSMLSNENATWFIDPPYIGAGYCYKESSKNIDYGHLSDWCKSRNGQVIVCENYSAKWLPFKKIKSFKGANSTNDEAIWSNLPTSYGGDQMTLF